MKKIFLFALMLATCVACDDNDNGPDFENDNDEIVNGRIVDDDPMEFLGTMTVTNPDGTTFVDDKARLDIVGDGGPSISYQNPATTLSIYMHRMRFAEAMPALEMRINTLTYTPGVGPNLTFSTAGPVIPQAYIAGAGWTEQANYPITGLNGAINNVLCTLEFTCMGTHVKFEGRMLD